MRDCDECDLTAPHVHRLGCTFYAWSQAPGDRFRKEWRRQMAERLGGRPTSHNEDEHFSADEAEEQEAIARALGPSQARAMAAAADDPQSDKD